VLESAVIGKTDDDLTKTKTKTYLVLKAGTQAAEAELQAFVKEKLAPYKSGASSSSWTSCLKPPPTRSSASGGGNWRRAETNATDLAVGGANAATALLFQADVSTPTAAQTRLYLLLCPARPGPARRRCRRPPKPSYEKPPHGPPADQAAANGRDRQFFDAKILGHQQPRPLQ
jgi:hypothetical protein